MTFELYVWGPGYGLPSIDPDSLASILFFQRFLSEELWCIVPCGDPSTIPTGQLPALKDDWRWISGFHNVVKYLSESASISSYDTTELSLQQKADAIAYSAFIQSRGRPLLDLSLYVSSENYNGATRAVLADILDWPGSWSIPHKLRREAKARSDHLGLSGLDVDAATDPERESIITNHLPESMKKVTPSPSQKLGHHEQKSRIRLDAVTRDFLEPIGELLRGHEWLIGDSAGVVDCLALGYLLLMQRPQLPHSWLQSTLQNEFPRINEWIKTKTQSLSEAESLPWNKAQPRRWIGMFNAVINHGIGSIPALRYDTSEISLTSTDAVSRRSHERQVALARLRGRSDMYNGLVTSLVSCSGVVAWLLWAGVLELPRKTTSHGHTRVFGRQPMGEAESILMGLG